VPPLPTAFPQSPSLPPPSSSSVSEKPKHSANGFTLYHHSFTMKVAEDGSIRFENEPNIRLRTLGASFDATDAILRWLGQDPYLSDKLAMMDETRPERIRMRRAFNKTNMEAALGELPHYLARIWNEKSWTPATRRAILFALWDEAAEQGNELARQGGAHARTLIVHFVAANLPPGSPNSFTPDELVAFNADRASVTHFSPYDEPEAGTALAAVSDDEPIQIATTTPAAAAVAMNAAALMRRF